MKARNVPLLFAVGGGLITAVSVLWEYVRVAPSYRFLVEPWSLRGYEMTQGWVVVTIGVGIAVLGYLSARPAETVTYSLTVAGIAWMAAILLTQYADTRPIVAEYPAPFALLISAVVSLIVVKITVNLAGSRVPPRWRGWGQLGVWLALTLLLHFAVAMPLVVDDSMTIEASVVVAVAFALVFALALTIDPPDLGVSRIAVFAVVIAMIVVPSMSGSLRTHLLEQQVEAIGVSAQFKDVQVTSGLIIAFWGLLFAFFGAVGLWARKRDLLAARARARRQMAAAAASAAEIKDAGSPESL